MKKLSLLLTICVILTMLTIPTLAVTVTNTKLTTAESSIIKAYQKTLEMQDIQYINVYKYPGSKFQLDASVKNKKVKILNPQYSKVYDLNIKMNKLCISGLRVVTDGKILEFSNTTSGVYVKSKNNKLYAYKEVAKEKISLLKVKALTKSTLLSLEKYLTSLYGKETAAALMYPKNDSKTDADTDTNEGTDKDGKDTSIDETNDNAVVSPTDGVGTIISPINLNQKYTWSETREYLGNITSGTYSFTVKSVKKVSLDDIVTLGLIKPEVEDRKEYAIVDVIYEVKDAKLKVVTGKKQEFLTSGWKIDIDGVKTENGDALYADYDMDFAGCLYKFLKPYDLKEVSEDISESYKVEGKLLITLLKNKTNYLVIQNQTIKDYNSSLIYFKLDSN